jgi:hypothetical protein
MHSSATMPSLKVTVLRCTLKMDSEVVGLGAPSSRTAQVSSSASPCSSFGRRDDYLIDSTCNLKVLVSGVNFRLLSCEHVRTTEHV